MLHTLGGDAVAAVYAPLHAEMDESAAKIMRRFLLAADVLREGEEKALAREPEEMRRVVRLILERRD
jgi:hypothetical protein